MHFTTVVGFCEGIVPTVWRIMTFVYILGWVMGSVNYCNNQQPVN